MKSANSCLPRNRLQSALSRPRQAQGACSLCLYNNLARRACPDRGCPEARHHEKANCVPLTDAPLGQVVEQIVAWYDAVVAVLIAESLDQRGGGLARPARTGAPVPVGVRGYEATPLTLYFFWGFSMVS